MDIRKNIIDVLDKVLWTKGASDENKRYLADAIAEELEKSMQHTEKRTSATLDVKNVPQYAADCPYWVVTRSDGALWFFGAYDEDDYSTAIAAVDECSDRTLIWFTAPEEKQKLFG